MHIGTSGWQPCSHAERRQRCTAGPMLLGIRRLPCHPVIAFRKALCARRTCWATLTFILPSSYLPCHALLQCRKSAVREVHLLGRRGPVQAAFTPKELRELLSLEGVQVGIVMVLCRQCHVETQS